MSRLKKGDTIRCQSLDEVRVYLEGVKNDGYEAYYEFDIRTHEYVLIITEDKEAADE